MRALSGFLMIVAIAGLVGLGSARAGAVDTAAPEQVRALAAQGVKVIDIRRADEWRDTGVIPGSILLTAIDADGRLVEGFPAAFSEAVKRDEPVIVICRSGNRSAVVSQLLSENGGYSHVINAAGGMRAWIDAGNPVTPCTRC
jgi:rhodanese-related sulfurtransferase